MPDRGPHLTEKQRLLEQLRQQREKTALSNYRQDCAVLFDGLSGGIQDLLAQENRPCSRDSVFCRRLQVSAENESMDSRLHSRKPRQSPEPISPEIEAADEEALREMIRVEKSQYREPVVVLPWEKLIEELVPCLEKLMRSADDGKAEDCREALKELRRILELHHICPIWYDDEMVKQNEVMQWDYISASTYPVPALYYKTETEYIRVGAPGYAGAKTENE